MPNTLVTFGMRSTRFLVPAHKEEWLTARLHGKAIQSQLPNHLAKAIVLLVAQLHDTLGLNLHAKEKNPSQQLALQG